jgi:hypothetical protein
MAKGGAFEREVCNKLSDWWTGHPDSSVFWRTANSGGRATVRRLKGKQTAGHCGDIGAVDSVGTDLIKVVTIEVKRGYSKEVFSDLLDYPKKLKPGIFEGFIVQAKTAAETAGTPYWMLIHRRDRREPTVYVPREFYTALKEKGAFGTYSVPAPFVEAKVKVRMSTRQEDAVVERIVVMRFDRFLSLVPPKAIKKIARQL